MNKLLTKVAKLVLGLSLAAGVGVAVGTANKASRVDAATGSATISGGTVVGSGTSATITWTLASGNITAVSHSGGGNAVANTDRLYRYNYIEFTATNNYTITSLEITYNGNYRGANNAGGTAVSNDRISAGQSDVTVVDTNVSGGKITVTPNSTANTHFFFQNAATGSTNTQLRWTEFKVNYSYESSTPSVSFNDPTDAVGVDLSITNAATGNNLSGASISYSSGDTSVATVDSSTGEVTGVAFGSTTITATATVNSTDYSDSYTIYVVSSSTAYYSVAQARAAIDTGKGLNNQYVKGVVYRVDSYDSSRHQITYWISDNGSSSVPFEVYGGLGIGGADFSSIDDVTVGDIVVVKGQIKKSGSTYEFNYQNELVSQISIASIAVKTAPSDVAYDEGELFDPTGLVVTATYDDTPSPTTKDFAYADLDSAFTFDPSTSTALTNQSSVSISLFGKSTTQAITVTRRTISSITVTGTDMTNKTYVKGAVWDFTGLSLTVTYNSGDPAVIAMNTLTAGTDFTLDHSTADGATSLTISGTYDGHSITSRTITGITYVSEVTFTAGTDVGVSTSQTADSISKYGVSLSCTSFWSASGDYRFYKDSTVTLTSTGENIRKIEFTDGSDTKNPITNLVLKTGEGGTYSDLTWLGDDSVVEFTASAQARASAVKVTTDSGYAEIHVNGLSVNGSAATIGQEFNLEIVKNKTYTLDVAVTPNNTTDSNVVNYSVASGSGASVSAAGIITAGSTVGGTAVIRAESDADSTYYVLFNVTVIDCKTVYDIDFSCTASTTQFTETTWGNATNGSDADDLAYDSNNTKVYPDANAIKFGSSSVAGSLKLTTPGSVEIERVVIHAKSYNSETDTSTIAVNNGTEQTATADWSYLVFDLSTTSDEVTIEGTTASKGRFYIDDIVFIGTDNQAAVGAYGYAAEFLNETAEDCAAGTGINSTTWSSLGSSWSSCESSYAGSNSYFLSKTANENGKIIEEALARYDNILANYGGTNFMNRSTSGGAKLMLSKIAGENTNTIAIIVIISLVSVTAIGGYFFIKRREQN